MKKCSCCGDEKCESNFHIKDSNTGRLSNRCKICESDIRKNKYVPKTSKKENLQKKLDSPAKICTKCGEEKGKSEFHSDKQKFDKLASSCKICKNKQNLDKASTAEYKERKKNYDKAYNKSDAGKEVNRKGHEKRKEKYHSDPEFREREKGRLRLFSSQPEQKKKAADRQREMPNELRAKHTREWRQRNRDKFNAWSRAYIKKNKHRFAWRQMLADTHRRIGTKKEDRTVEELGYSAEILKLHMENLFQEGMSWDNHGEWHIDHIKPVSSFDKNTKPSIINALSNLQPLWAKDNLSKGTKY